MLNYRVGVWLSIVLLPFSATQLMPRQLLGITGLNTLNIILVATIVSAFFSMAKRPGSVRLPRLPVTFMAYIGLIVAGAAAGLFYIDLVPPRAVGDGIENGLSPLGYLLENLFKPLIIVVVALLAAVTVTNEKFARRLVTAISVALLLFSMVVLLNQFTSGLSLSEMASSKSRRMLSWMGIHANDIGHLCNLGVALTLFAFLGTRNAASRWFYAAAAVLGAAAAALTFSRSAFLGLLTIGAYFLISRRRFWDLFFAAMAMVIVAILLPDAFIERALTGIGEEDTTAITAGRLHGIWLPLLPEFLASPIWGHGLSSMLWSGFNRPVFIVGHPHNAYLGVLLDFGVLGGIIVAAFWFRMWGLFRVLYRYHEDPFWRSFYEGAKLGIFVALVQGLTGQKFVPWFPHAFLWIAFGIALGMNTKLRLDKLSRFGTLSRRTPATAVRPIELRRKDSPLEL
ncbi:O-antigen ligase family protein [Rhabdochromatium marinum]|uniref:O-antigen ligase family protein n=1 Tax=Rhabdochromatium marinum TaxID=48729 RepID=UPI00190666C3|nr:O-antigen ligase family protein [Rhabdochromatium marinum]